MSISADLSGFAKLAQDLAGAAVQSDANIARAIDEVAPKILAEQKANAPYRTGLLRESLEIDRIGPAECRIGAIRKASLGKDGHAGWRAHFIEDGTAHSAPQPFIRPAGAKYESEFARSIVTAPVFRR